jgi:hypothetical protein
MIKWMAAALFCRPKRLHEMCMPHEYHYLLYVRIGLFIMKQTQRAFANIARAPIFSVSQKRLLELEAFR